ncbi:MAG TPA: tetratricopeptide repeat protein [Bryobacteraceae bacterium]|jgi:hypothetical protein
MGHRSWLLTVLALALSPAIPAAGAGPRWICAQNPNFEVYSTADEASVSDTLLEFEQVRSFFQSLASLHEMHRTEKQAPVRIVAFSTAKEYEPYRPNQFAVAFYFPGIERDTIVMSHAGAEAFPVAIHEYFHLTMEHLGLKLPPWLGEGMAELYSTLHPLGGRTILGELIPSRVRALRENKWVPLQTILAADSRSPYYNEKNKAGSLYDEGWALTHMLYLSPEYRPRFADLLIAIAVGKDSAEALTSVYGKPVEAIEKDLQVYLRGTRFRAMVLAAGMQTGDVSAAPQPASGFDVRLILAELTQRHAPDDPGAKQQWEALAAEQPNRPEPHVQLGYLLWRSNPQAQSEVQKEFARAFALGDRSPKMMWDYGRMIEGSQPRESAEAFRQLLAMEPDRTEVSIELASALLAGGQPVEAAKILTALPRVLSFEDAPRYFSVAAYVALGLGDRDQARVLAGKLMDAPKSSPADKQRAQRLLDYLK